MRGRVLFLGLVVLLGVGVRVALMPHDCTPAPGSDSDEYDTYAWNMAEGRGYRGMSPAYPDGQHLTSWRMPGPSLVFAAVYKTVGHRPRFAILLNILLSVITCIPLFFIALACHKESTAKLTATIYALWPSSVYWSVGLFSEPLFTLVYMLFIWRSLVLAGDMRFRNILISGVLMGALLLVRPHPLFLFFVFIWVVIVFWPRWSRMLAGCCVFVVAGLMLAPWIVRNERVHSAFVPFTTSAGTALFNANNSLVATDPKWHGYAIGDERMIPEYRSLYATVSNEVEWSSLSMTLCRRWLRDNPDKWCYLVSSKFFRFWTPRLEQPSRRNRMVMLWSWGPVLVLSIIPFFVLLSQYLRTRDPRLIVHGAILSTMLNSLVFGALPRYRLPIEGLCIVLACMGLEWVVRRALAHKDTSTASQISP